MADRKILDKLDKGVSHIIVFAQAASINAQVDCVYPESFIIGVLTTGPNLIASILSELNVDLEKTLIIFKKELSKKTIDNENKSQVCLEDLKVSKVLIEACYVADKIREEISSDKEGISVQHVFLALLKTSSFITQTFEKEGVTYDIVCERIKHVRELEPAGGEIRKSNKSLKAIESFCTDITKLARENKLDPIIAREKEIEMAITILCRRGKNNPILLGHAGTGKTALVEGIAQRIVSGTVPKQLIGHKIYSLSLGSLVAGTKYRGEFEERIQSLVEEIQKTKDSILFIDEIHTLVGAGSASGGSLDASNILKPFLARSDLRCIGATTLADFKKYFEKDSALTRRFQQIMVEEPTKEQMHQILLGIKSRFEQYHKCIITEDAIGAAINLSAKYMTEKKFPDKAIDCIDMSCAKHAWETGKKAKPTIIGRDVAMVVSEQCGIPIEVILWDDNERMVKIEGVLASRVMGQARAIKSVCDVLKNSYSGIKNPDKPIGSFLFGGPTGCGKTYMAKELSKAVFGRDNCFVKLDMTEYSEPHSVSKLIGSPPGYVGFQETDVFIDKIKRKPYCIILLDEIEKAHPDVMKMFLQVMSDGIMTDATSNKVDFKNVVLIMTGNFGLNEEAKQSLGFTELAKKDAFNESQKRLINFCKEMYGQEFVNRIDEFIPFMSLNDEDLKKIAKIRLDEVCDRLVSRKCKLTFTDSVFDLLINMSKEEYGKNATVLNRLIAKKIEPCISDALLSTKSQKSYVINVDAKDGEFKCEIEKK